jgi:hypothetical protein
MVHEMNCKPGDLAIVVRCPDEAYEIGKIVTCLRREDFLGVPAWRIDPPLRTVTKGDWMVEGSWIEDACLRPIRDNPGKDETLDWCPVPTKETA